MNELLGNPAIQSAVVPFVVALAVSAALGRTRFLAMAQVAGFMALAALAIGLSFESLTATKKLVLLGAGTGLLALAVEWRGAPLRWRQSAAAAVLAAGCIWMLWRLLAQKEAGEAVFSGALATLYVAAVVGSTLFVSDDPVRGASAGLMIGLGTGALGVLGASAVLGLVGISAGAAAGATLLVQMVRGRAAEAGTSISLPASGIAALAGALAVFSASLSWYALLPVVAAPWATSLVPVSLQPAWLRAVLSSLAALVPMAGAVALAWLRPGAPT
ncbi:MAG: hypothetical protein HY854_10815 [Burkholderiales bacterium]|nr:hypothetical protein [Burkholderiales bacterium]